jgi:hypothetical protein
LSLSGPLTHHFSQQFEGVFLSLNGVFLVEAFLTFIRSLFQSPTEGIPAIITFKATVVRIVHVSLSFFNRGLMNVGHLLLHVIQFLF